MRHLRYKSLILLLALLLAASSWIPLPGRAEAQMRCVGASPQSAPCAQADLPAAGLTRPQVYGALMACCRSAHRGCARMRNCPMPRRAHAVPTMSRLHLSAPRCMITVRIAAPVAATPAVRNTRQFLSASPAQAPPALPFALAAFPVIAANVFWTFSPVLPPPAAPQLHGLRAPPAV